MSALTDPDSMRLRDVEVEGDCHDDPAWRALVGLDKPEPTEDDE